MNHALQPHAAAHAPQDADDTHGTPEHPLLREWQRLTRQGLAASRAHCVAHALTWHTRALGVARQLLAHAEDGIAADDRLAAYVVAHLNLADCYAGMDQPASAAECLCRAHHKLMALLHSDTAPPSLRMAAARHLHHTHAALHLHHGPQGGPVPGSPLLH